jgi:hypothetical protein
VTTVAKEGDPRVDVIDVAAEWHADLIMVGAQGRKGLDRFFLGSVSEAVARHASCSVQIARVPTEMPTHLAVSSNARRKDVGNPEGTIQTPIALEPEERKQFCKVADHPYKLDESLPKWRGWYALRRGVGTAIADLSNSVAAKGLLRHSSVSTTERHYIKDVPESTLEAMKLLEVLCNPSATDTAVKPS